MASEESSEDGLHCDRWEETTASLIEDEDELVCFDCAGVDPTEVTYDIP